MSARGSAASVLCRVLEAEGIQCGFGVPGTPTVPLFEALRTSEIQTVLATQETAAGFMANGYARTGGRPGLLLTSPGPGFTYAVPPLAEARLDSAPLLHVAVKSAVHPHRSFQHQLIPQAEMVRELVKAVVEVDRPEELAEAARAAHARALSGEPGPVVLHVNEDVLGARVEMPGTGLKDGSRRGGAPRSQHAQSGGDPSPSLHERVRASERPVILAGAGAAASADSVRALVEALPAPIVTTPSARGLLPERHPLALGFDAARGGVSVLNDLLSRCDLVLALGCKLSHAGSAGFQLDLDRRALVHVNTDAGALGANYPTDLAIHAPVAPVVAELLENLAAGSPRSEWTSEEVAAWSARIREQASSGPPEPEIPGAPGGTPAGFFRLLRETLPDDGIVVTDAGLHQTLVRRHLSVQAPRGLLTPTDFGSMGFGIPAAIGAVLAAPERPVVAVVGDGGLAMSAMELLTASREALPLVVVVFNDGHLNLIRLQHLRAYGRSHATEMKNPDLEGLARSLGAAYERWNADPDAALRRALENRVPTLVEVRVEDSAAIRSEAAKGRARAMARGLLGPRVRSGLRRLLDRD